MLICQNKCWLQLKKKWVFVAVSLAIFPFQLCITCLPKLYRSDQEKKLLIISPAAISKSYWPLILQSGVNCMSKRKLILKNLIQKFFESLLWHQMFVKKYMRPRAKWGKQSVLCVAIKRLDNLNCLKISLQSL